MARATIVRRRNVEEDVPRVVELRDGGRVSELLTERSK
jgi:hypothetical protein